MSSNEFMRALSVIHARPCPTCKVTKLFSEFCARERYQLPGADWTSEKVHIFDDCNECRGTQQED